MDSTDKKPDIKPDVTGEKIRLRVEFDKKEFTITLKRHHSMKKVFDAAGKAFQMDPRVLKFFYCGKRVNVQDILADMELEDGDEITAGLEHLGG